MPINSLNCSETRFKPLHLVLRGISLLLLAAFLSDLFLWPASILAASESFASLHAFGSAASFGTYGRDLSGELMQGRDGNLYGVTKLGGTSNAGTIFSLTPRGIWTTLHSFTGGKNGNWPIGGLVQASDGAFYGTTLYGGNTNGNNGFGYGTIFRLASNGKLTTIHSFSGTDGYQPAGELIQGKDGALYGVTSSGGSANLQDHDWRDANRAPLLSWR